MRGVRRAGQLRTALLKIFFLMLILILKLIGAPLFLAAATLAARRWGETAGGLIAALPLVSGPISVFLAIENGTQFTCDAAFGSLAGTAALAFFRRDLRQTLPSKPPSRRHL